MNLAEFHLIIGLAEHLKVCCFRQVPSQVLLHDHRILGLEEPLPLGLGQEHPDVALQVDNDELKLHSHYPFPRFKASVPPLDYSGR